MLCTKVRFRCITLVPFSYRSMQPPVASSWRLLSLLSSPSLLLLLLLLLLHAALGYSSTCHSRAFVASHGQPASSVLGTSQHIKSGLAVLSNLPTIML